MWNKLRLSFDKDLIVFLFYWGENSMINRKNLCTLRVALALRGV